MGFGPRFSNFGPEGVRMRIKETFSRVEEIQQA